MTLAVGANGGLPEGTFTLTAVNGPVSLYWLTVGSSADGALTVSPPNGTLPQGQTVTITLSLTEEESLDTQVVINPGDAMITVLYTAPRTVSLFVAVGTGRPARGWRGPASGFGGVPRFRHRPVRFRLPWFRLPLLREVPLRLTAVRRAPARLVPC